MICAKTKAHMRSIFAAIMIVAVILMFSTSQLFAAINMSYTAGAVSEDIFNNINSDNIGDGDIGNGKIGDGETGNNEAGDGETGDDETGDSGANDNEPGDGETSDNEIEEGEIDDNETGDGETGNSETGEDETEGDETGDDETEDDGTEEGETVNEAIKDGETQPAEETLPSPDKEILILYLISQAEIIYGQEIYEKQDALREYLEYWLEGIEEDDFYEIFSIYYLNSFESSIFIDEIMQYLFAENARKVLYEELLGGGRTYSDPQAQAALENFILYEMEDDFARQVLEWINELETIEWEHWVEYLLQAMDYQYPVDDPLLQDDFEFTEDEANEYLLSIGMKPISEVEEYKAYGSFGAPGSYFRSYGNNTQWDSTVYPEDTADDSMVNNFCKTARPMDELFRTYEITMDFDVGESQHSIPGESEPVDVVFVIDRSSSMADNTVVHNDARVTRMNAVKSISKSLAKQILEADSQNRVSIVSFSDSASVNIALTSRGIKENEYRPYPHRITWENYLFEDGFPVSDYPQLYYINAEGDYVPVTANAVVNGFLVYWYTRVNSGGTHFVPEYAGINTGRSTTFYIKAGGYTGVSEVCDAIDSLIAYGNTNIQDGIMRGQNVLAVNGGQNKRVMILLTDGEANRKTDSNWDKVNLQSGITSSTYEKSAMLEGQWTVEQGTDLFAVGFSVNSEALKRTSWTLSEGGTRYLNIQRSTTANSLGLQHRGYVTENRYYTTTTASGLENIFKEIEDTIINIGDIANVVLTDKLSAEVINNFDISDINFTGALKNAQPGNIINPAFTAEYSDQTGTLSINISEPLATGSYKLSFMITALPDKYINEGDGFNIETNAGADISYEYIAYTEDSTEPVTMRQCQLIESSPTVDVPPIITLGLKDNGIVYAGSEYGMTGTIHIPNVSNDLGCYRIPDTWVDYYSNSNIAANAAFMINEKAVEGLTECLIKSEDIYVTVEAGINEYLLTGDYHVSGNNYQLILGCNKPVRVFGAVGRLIYNLSGEIKKGMFDIITSYGGGKQLHVGLEPEGSEEFELYDDIGSIFATTYVPYGYTQTTDVNGLMNSEGNIILNLLESIQSAAGTYENACEILKSGDTEKINQLEESINNLLTVKVEASINKRISPWFRDWAWKKLDGTYESEVRLK